MTQLNIELFQYADNTIGHIFDIYRVRLITSISLPSVLFKNQIESEYDENWRVSTH